MPWRRRSRDIRRQDHGSHTRRMTMMSTAPLKHMLRNSRDRPSACYHLVVFLCRIPPNRLLRVTATSRRRSRLIDEIRRRRTPARLRGRQMTLTHTVHAKVILLSEKVSHSTRIGPTGCSETTSRAAAQARGRRPRRRGRGPRLIGPDGRCKGLVQRTHLDGNAGNAQSQGGGWDGPALIMNGAMWCRVGD